MSDVQELRLVLTVPDFDAALRFYRDALGLEVGRRVAGPMRVGFQVADSSAAADRLEGAGATRIAGPVVTPWNDRNVRLQAPDGTQLTLFTPAE